MNDHFEGGEEPAVPAEKLAGMQRRVQSLNAQPRPLWQWAAGGLVLAAVFGAIGYSLYEAYFDVKPEIVVEEYRGVRIAGSGAQKDAQAAIAEFHASPAYAAAQERARKELAQEAASGAQ